MTNDSFAYIPLFLSAVVSLVTIALLFANKKNGSKTTFIMHLVSSVVICVGSVYTALFPGLTIYAASITLAVIIELISSFFKNNKEKQPAEISAELAEAELSENQLEEVENNTDEKDSEVRQIVEAGRDFMLHSAEAFSDESGLNTLLNHINEAMVRETEADGGVILLLDEFDDVLAVKNLTGDFPPPYKLPEDLPHKLVRIETNFRFSQFPLSETIFGAIARSGKAELITDPLSDSRIYQNETEDFLKCGTYIFAPLKIRDTVIGVIAVARRFTSKPFNEEDFQKTYYLSTLASTAIKVLYSYQEVIEHAELTKESGIACKLQNSLHPKLLPQIPSLSLGCYYKTSDGVCGDYYDIIPARKDRISFVVGDVAGKGMNSLMIMTMLRAILRLTVNTTQSAGTILGWANRGITAESNIVDHFASLALINYDTTSNKVQIATCGTNPVLLYSIESDTIKQVSDAYEPVGVEKTTVYNDKEFTVQSGDIIVTYTDGVIEIPNDKGLQYSQERLMEIIRKNKHLSGKEIADVVKSDIAKFSGSSHQHDDQTLLIIKVQ